MLMLGERHIQFRRAISARFGIAVRIWRDSFRFSSRAAARDMGVAASSLRLPAECILSSG